MIFSMEIVINDLKFGIGHGDTMKQAKHDAAGITIGILEPSIRERKKESSYFKVCLYLFVL